MGETQLWIDDIAIGRQGSLSTPGAISQKTTGFRQLDVSDSLLNINGVQRFLRGNIDCCVYPLIGYPRRCATSAGV